MFASLLTFNPRSKATNIGDRLSSVAVLWLEGKITIGNWRIGRFIMRFSSFSVSAFFIVLTIYYWEDLRMLVDDSYLL